MFSIFIEKICEMRRTALALSLLTLRFGQDKPKLSRKIRSASYRSQGKTGGTRQSF